MSEKRINVKVKITKERFYNEETSFGIYVTEVLDVLESEDWDGEPYLEYAKYGKNVISIKGTLGKLTIGDEYVASVVHEPHDTYTGNYKLWNIYRELPKDKSSQKMYLRAMMTEKQFEEFINVYGEEKDLIILFQDDLIDFSKVKGLGEKTYTRIREKIMSSMDLSEVIIFSEKYNIPFEVMKKYSLKLGNPSLAVRKIAENPYLLTQMDGIGFLKADKIATKLGIEPNSKFRIDACVQHLLQESANSGHTWIGESEIVKQMNSILDISNKEVVYGLDSAVNDEHNPTLKIDGKYTNVYFVTAEKVISNQILSLIKNENHYMKESIWEKKVDEFCKKKNYKLHKNQRKFLLDWNKNQVNLLIGYGGSGKTFIQNVLIGILEDSNLYTPFALLAPTGRASKVQSLYTGKPASTIHRALTKVIDNDFMIIDETSMADVFIMSTLLKAIQNPKMRILFVGDDFQIPSVGVGNLLYDMINSNVIPTTKLTQIFRQEDGGIKDISHKIRNGEKFLNSGDSGRKKFGKDTVFWLVEPQHVLKGVLKNYQNVLSKYSQDDILVLSPTNKGALGTVAVNNRIQELVNPESEGKNEFTVKRGENETTFRVGDRVLNKKNNYSMDVINSDNIDNLINDFDLNSDNPIGDESDSITVDVFNGDVGTIVRVDSEKRTLDIDFDGYIVEFVAEEIQSLLHGWSMTIHSAQGSQAKVVILILNKSATFQLNANLIYTGVSRASEIMLVIGQVDVINSSIKKFQNMQRRSFLQDFLKHGYDGEFVIGDDEDKDLSLQGRYSQYNEIVKEIVAVYNKDINVTEELEEKDSSTKKYIYL